MSLENIFGDTSETRIVDYLANCEPYDRTVSEISKCTGLSRTSIYEKISKLIKFGLIIETRKLNKMRFYAIANSNQSKLIQQFILTIAYDLSKNNMDIEKK